MPSEASIEGHELVLLTLNKKHPKPLSYELLEPKPCINFADAWSLCSECSRCEAASELPCTFAVFEEHDPNFASWDPIDSEWFKNK